LHDRFGLNQCITTLHHVVHQSQDEADPTKVERLLYHHFRHPLKSGRSRPMERSRLNIYHLRLAATFTSRSSSLSATLPSDPPIHTLPRRHYISSEDRHNQSGDPSDRTSTMPAGDKPNLSSNLSAHPTLVQRLGFDYYYRPTNPIALSIWRWQ
jgi:hypothetical protein